MTVTDQADRLSAGGGSAYGGKTVGCFRQGQISLQPDIPALPKSITRLKLHSPSLGSPTALVASELPDKVGP